MIKLSRINGKEFMLNSDLIEQIEATPDTMITLINGKTIRVAEPMEVVLKRVIQFRRRIQGLRPVLSKNLKKSGK